MRSCRSSSPILFWMVWWKKTNLLFLTWTFALLGFPIIPVIHLYKEGIFPWRSLAVKTLLWLPAFQASCQRQTHIGGWSLLDLMWSKTKRGSVEFSHSHAWRGVGRLYTAPSRSRQTRSQTCGSLRREDVGQNPGHTMGAIIPWRPEGSAAEQPAIFTRRKIIQSDVRLARKRLAFFGPSSAVTFRSCQLAVSSHIGFYTVLIVYICIYSWLCIPWGSNSGPWVKFSPNWHFFWPPRQRQ